MNWIKGLVQDLQNVMIEAGEYERRNIMTYYDNQVEDISLSMSGNENNSSS